MNLWQAIILGILQGVTEFIPVSSSGHLVLFQKIMGIREEVPLTFDILVHLGTLVAVFIVFWSDIWELIKKPFQKMTYLLIVGTIPTVLLALVFKDYIEAAFASGRTLGIGFLITGCILLYAEKANSGKKALQETSYLDVGFVGLMQGLAMLPAVSRSGMTISGALFRNMDKKFAAKYSFMLSIPAILGAAVFDLKDVVKQGSLGLEFAPAASAFIAAAVAGYVAIKFMLELIQKQKLRYFSYYVFALAALVLMDQYVTKIFF